MKVLRRDVLEQLVIHHLKLVCALKPDLPDGTRPRTVLINFPNAPLDDEQICRVVDRVAF